MDRPLGAQPDKRNAAYESIFGRPSTIHHQSQRPVPPSHPYTPSYAQSFRQQPYNGQHANTQPQYQQPYDHRPRNNYAPSINAHRQSYYPSQPPIQQQPYEVHNQGGAGYPPPPALTYPRSAISAQGVIAAPPEVSIDPGLEDLTRSGLTPAQAYQAQFYASTPMNRNSVSSQSSSHSHSHSGQLHEYERPPVARPQGPRDPPVPRLGLQGVDGRFDVEFSGDSSPPSNPSTEEGDTGRSTDASSVRRDGDKSDGSSEYHGLTGPPTRPYPLQLDTALSAKPKISDSHSPASSTFVDQASSPIASSSRRSSDSIRTLPPPALGRRERERSVQDRSRSMSATTSQARAMLSDLKQAHLPAVPPLTSTNLERNATSQALVPSSRRTSIVYPALLSRVAEAFRARIQLAECVKDGLAYTDAFDGREAVDKIAYIIKTTDRNLALLLGRALDAQKFFHDVTYDHRLRDSPYELYQFRTSLRTPFVSGDLALTEHGHDIPSRPPMVTQGSSGESSKQALEDALTEQLENATLTDRTQRARSSSTSSDDAPLPTGVFTLLTDCYSPTCTRDQLCYSIACPRRLEQQARLNMKPQPGLKKSMSKESLDDLPVEPGTLWIHSVPKEIVDSVSDMEKKRQEAINEVIYTERDFVRDMEYLRDAWIGPLKRSDIIPENRRFDFLEQVFWNIHDIIAVNTRVRDAFNKRQKSYAVVERIGDILLDVVPHFGPFVSYGSHQLYGKYEFEREKSSNPAFQKFVDETERLPESRKLELNGYLTKPTTRLARYPLLLDVVLKYTSDDNPDKQELPKVIAMVREFLKKVNIESGKTENRFNLLQLDQQLVFRPNEEVDLRLREEGRELVYKGNFKRGRGGGQGDTGDLVLFLFDHALLMVKQKTKHEQYKVYRRPIPLELLLIYAPEEPAGKQAGKSTVKTLTKRNSFTRNAPLAPPAFPVKERLGGKDGFSITFVHLGRKYYQLTLYASTQVSRKKWVENITKQQEIMRERSLIFDTVTLSEGFFTHGNRVNCAAPFHGGRRVVYGTNDGVYFSRLRDTRDSVKVLNLPDITQVDILEDYQLLVVLSEHQVFTVPLEALDERDPNAALRRVKRISSHTSFFKAGTCLGRTLVCIVKASQLSSTIKVLEPIDHATRGKNKPTFRKLLQGGHDTLRPFREFYIPVESSSISFLKTRLCVGCTKGFEIVDLETLETQALLDPSDGALDFVQKREDVRPMAIYRIENDFLLCYDEFAFYVGKNGCRTRGNFLIHWEGHPRSFAFHYPYVLAFEPTFVEVWHVETGSLCQIVQGNNLRCLFADTPPSTTFSSSIYPYNVYQQGGAQGSVYAQHGGGYTHPSPSVSTPSLTASYVTGPPSYHAHGSSHGHGSGPGPHTQGFAQQHPVGLQSQHGHGGGGYPVYAQQQHQQFLQRPPPFARDEIIMLSDDRVMALQLAPQAAATSSDGASLASR